METHDAQEKAPTCVGSMGVPNVSRINRSMVGHWIVCIGGGANEKWKRVLRFSYFNGTSEIMQDCQKAAGDK